ncbi:hypothetical protein ACFOD4_21290 [Pseudoroseomonas globiformis]|uniref:Uncharacterized protein n=1 Tax=Teichococcus globiformis TaxID=2307229 RepID=A0ABV7G4H4_9PROT
MQITQEQIRLAEAHGCRFAPASPAQAQTFAMQRRIFWHEGQPWVAQRGDGFYETAATLQSLLNSAAPAVASVGQPIEPEVASIEPAPLPDMQPAVAGAMPPSSLRAQTAEMVTALLAKRQVGAQDLPALIRAVHGCLTRLHRAG